MLLELNFSKNLQVLKEINASLADKILQVKSNERFELFEKNYDIYDHKTKQFCIQNALDNLSFYEQNYKRHPFLIFFGIGNGMLIFELLKNPLKDYICVIEPEIELLYIALHLNDFSQDLQDKRLCIYLYEDINFLTFYRFFEQEKIHFFVKTYDLLLISNFYENYENAITTTNSLCIESIKSLVIRQGNSSEDSFEGITQLLHNLPYQLANPSLKDLLKQRKGKIENAIIVSTGPSLMKQLPLLKEYANKASIICADSAYPILAKHNIKPDYVLALERHDLVYQCFEQDNQEFDKDILFIIASVAHKSVIDTLEKTKKPYILVHRPLPFSKALHMDDYGYLGSGLSVANMAYDLAIKLGHKNIILIGQDLAYDENGNSHPKEYLHTQESENDRKEGLFITAYGGNGKVETNQWWILFKESLEYSIDTNSVTTYNATEGGARIEGSIEKPFKELCENLLRENKPLFEKLQTLSEKEIQDKKDKIDECLRGVVILGRSYINECEILKSDLARCLENLNFENQDFNPLSQRIYQMKAKFEDEEFKNYFLDLIRSIFFHFEYKIAQNYIKNPTNIEEEYAKRKEYIEIHINWIDFIIPHIKLQIQNIEKGLS
ncbi:motility associated factor glycosyltransferase family protein [Campylobacter sp. IFREMER_LSEM_CL2151]|uniref:motility associated factor glycosyltransferase family protein n=1 Tax=Campylobacter sp. IFREMER_LSEM_CL2151 TaxID=2911620 RepID=UPI0021E9A6D9|nr:motility associated factor glycosyltransferase family protein [Campylobacter sp. IFREMER_LSEM_CL2151]MCV3375958.1 motility associated factor glycosyltransferase family protein [Campylobacter sp. IFREMER_LSEM_CL2151]